MLTIHEKLLIERLRSPETSKATGKLGSGSYCCCLGHAGKVLDCAFESNGNNLKDIPDFDFSEIRFRGTSGKIDVDKITEKGWGLLYRNSTSSILDANVSVRDFKTATIKSMEGALSLSFMFLNDGTGYMEQMSHEDIATFMEENPEASFDMDAP